MFGIMKYIMLTFYKAAIESIITWFGNLSVKFKALFKAFKRERAGKIMGMPPLVCKDY